MLQLSFVSERNANAARLSLISALDTQCNCVFKLVFVRPGGSFVFVTWFEAEPQALMLRTNLWQIFI